ncbi:MAG: glucosidase [Planctomycetota bacterium]|nr:glucosidase [Planctomycetota bacterium]
MPTTSAEALHLSDPERLRLAEATDLQSPWRKWGPWLSERQWGTVREDYSADGDAWDSFPHDAARSRAYRWGEDGIAGFCDRTQQVCLGLAMWNGHDPILKERLFGLTNSQGNHGEDVKEQYFFLDAAPTGSYLRMLYRYPHAAFPYEDLVETNAARTAEDREYEILDTGVFDDQRYFDVFVEYAKSSEEQILMRIEVVNRGAEAATIHVIPQIWFRNTWSWGEDAEKPALQLDERGDGSILVEHPEVGRFRFASDASPTTHFCDNETNFPRVFKATSTCEHPKDAINDAIVDGVKDATDPDGRGTKAGLQHILTLGPGESSVIRLRLDPQDAGDDPDAFDETVAKRQKECHQFYAPHEEKCESPEAAAVLRQAYAGMIWGCQFYNYNVSQWLDGDPDQPAPPRGHKAGRNHDWRNIANHDILSMPDAWEYPWYATWDSAFQAVTFATIDPVFAKNQILLFVDDRYMHPNGELPAYEWAFGDVNPPVHAWAAWRVFPIERHATGGDGDLEFLKRVFHRLLLNFAWWVNRKDADGHNIFDGGFLGLDNIGAFDRSAPLPAGWKLQQADATSWVAAFALKMMRIALELSLHDPVYQDLAAKFFLHFLEIAGAMTSVANSRIGLWDEQSEFYFDTLVDPKGDIHPLRIFSLVGLIPLLAVETIEPELLDQLPEFKETVERTLSEKPEMAKLVSRWSEPGRGERRLLSLLRGHRMKCLFEVAFDEERMFSPNGIRSVSREHLEHPFLLNLAGRKLQVDYEPAESHTGLFGGNSNWRGPVWFPLNVLLIESMLKFHHYYGADFRIEVPTGSGDRINILQAANLLRHRLNALFLPDADGKRPIFGDDPRLNSPEWNELLPFNEFFCGDTGRGCGAMHQTGWTGLVAKLLDPESILEAKADLLE